MYQRIVPHHNTGGFTSHRLRLPDKEYGEALDCLVKGCSDMLLLSPDGGTILLGKRNVQPQPDWWFAGGRIFPGETPAQSCGRLLSREFGLEIAPARFQVVCCQSLAWGMREQPPQSNGTTDLQVVLSLLLTAPEVEKVVLDPQEYTASQVPCRARTKQPRVQPLAHSRSSTWTTLRGSSPYPHEPVTNSRQVTRARRRRLYLRLFRPSPDSCTPFVPTFTVDPTIGNPHWQVPPGTQVRSCLAPRGAEAGRDACRRRDKSSG